MTRALILALALLGLGAPAASAHSLVRVNGNAISYTSSDTTSLNTLDVDASSSGCTPAPCVRFYDPTVDGGMDIGPCSPGRLNSEGLPIEAFCSRGGIGVLRIDVADREDTVRVAIPIPAQIAGGPGADKLSGSEAADVMAGGDGNDELDGRGGNDSVIGAEGDDRLVGGEGNDVVQAALGLDTVDAGGGDDDVRVRDGLADSAACGAGADRAQTDDKDAVNADCEAVDRAVTAPPPSGGDGGGGGGSGSGGGSSGGGGGGGDGGGGSASGGGPDRTAPTVLAGAAATQRPLRSRRLTLEATLSEPGTLIASSNVDVGGRVFPLTSRRARITVGGAGERLRIKLPRAAVKRMRRILRKRSLRLVFTVVGTDVAGNSAEAKPVRVRLRK